MRKVTVEMPIISNCAVTDCAYNVTGSCGALAITVGDANNPRCDTYFAAVGHVSHTQIAAGVGACKVSACRHNHEFECTADIVKIGRPRGDAACLTFASA